MCRSVGGTGPADGLTTLICPCLQVEAGRREFLSFLGLLTGLSAAQAAQAADPYEVSWIHTVHNCQSLSRGTRCC